MIDDGLHPVEIRVLACLIEKQLSTPDYYPLTKNALLSACNQKSNRDPVMDLTTSTVGAAIRAMHARRLLSIRTGPNIRKEKYGHRLSEELALNPPEMALLCELMLRGPQTPGSLRTRCTRMVAFPDLGTLVEHLEGLAAREVPLVHQLPRHPGQSERRWIHLVGDQEGAVGSTAGGSEESTEEVALGSAPPTIHEPAWDDPLTELRAEVRSLRDELLALRTQFAEFRTQFD